MEGFDEFSGELDEFSSELDEITSDDFTFQGESVDEQNSWDDSKPVDELDFQFDDVQNSWDDSKPVDELDFQFDDEQDSWNDSESDDASNGLDVGEENFDDLSSKDVLDSDKVFEDEENRADEVELPQESRFADRADEVEVPQESRFVDRADEVEVQQESRFVDRAEEINRSSEENGDLNILAQGSEKVLENLGDAEVFNNINESRRSIDLTSEEKLRFSEVEKIDEPMEFNGVVKQDFNTTSLLAQEYTRQLARQYEQILARIIMAEMLMNYGQSLITAMMINNSSVYMTNLAMSFAVMQNDLRIHNIAELARLQSSLNISVGTLTNGVQIKPVTRVEKKFSASNQKTDKKQEPVAKSNSKKEIEVEKPKETVNDSYNNAQNEYYSLQSAKNILEQKGLSDSNQYKEIITKMGLVRQEVDTLMEVKAASRQAQSNYYGEKSGEIIAQESIEDRMSRINLERMGQRRSMKHLEEIELAGSGKYVAAEAKIGELNSEYELLQKAQNEIATVDSLNKRTTEPLQVANDMQLANNVYSLTDFKEKRAIEQSRQNAMTTQASINAATMATMTSSQNPSMVLESSSVAMGRK